ncbi:MAG: hypothetical protein HP002_08550 [Lentisphaeria bacterium]|nr:hypothetical protein [Lentisphaeria bacterium]
MEWYETPKMLAERARRFNELVEWCRENKIAEIAKKLNQTYNVNNNNND